MSRAATPSEKPSAELTVAFATLGCKTNQFESAAMQESLRSAGYLIVPFEEGAGLVVINTCTVTSATDAQSRNLIRKARRYNPACRVIVTGCYAQVDPDVLVGLPGVSLVIGNQEKQQLLDYLGQGTLSGSIAVSDIRQNDTFCLQPLTSFSGRSRAFVQIQNGCDAFCSYCIIPYARGASRSAPAEDVLQQVSALVHSGYQEIVLTGIHIGGYGADLPAPINLQQLVHRLVIETRVHRLRLGSIEPTELSGALIRMVSSSEVLCPHFHIPLQSGDDDLLQQMGRDYDVHFFRHLMESIVTHVHDAAICLDVITGFPGESEQQFKNTYDFIASLPVSDLHVFPYSQRPGTPAAKLSGQLPGKLKKERAEKLRLLAVEKHRTYAESFIGLPQEVVVESGTKNGYLKGVARNYLDIRFRGEATLVGKCVTVRPLQWQNDHLRAEMI